MRKANFDVQCSVVQQVLVEASSRRRARAPDLALWSLMVLLSAAFAGCGARSTLDARDEQLVGDGGSKDAANDTGGDATGPVCGDGICAPGEEQSCSRDCPRPDRCGDGICGPT